MMIDLLASFIAAPVFQERYGKSIQRKMDRGPERLLQKPKAGQGWGGFRGLGFKGFRASGFIGVWGLG